MNHCEAYSIVVSDEGIPVFVLPRAEIPPEKPILLYDNGRHGTLFRRDDDVVLIDFISQAVRQVLSQADYAVVMEKNITGDAIEYSYKVRIKKIKFNPLTDGITN